jgi:hypothetical protein
LALNAAACPFSRTALVDDIVQVLPLVSMIAAPSPAVTIEPFGDGVDVEVLLKVISCKYYPF